MYLEIQKETMNTSRSKCGSTGSRFEELPPDCEGGVETTETRCLMQLLILRWRRQTVVFESPVVTLHTTAFIIQIFYVLPTQCEGFVYI